MNYEQAKNQKLRVFFDDETMTLRTFPEYYCVASMVEVPLNPPSEDSVLGYRWSTASMDLAIAQHREKVQSLLEKIHDGPLKGYEPASLFVLSPVFDDLPIDQELAKKVQKVMDAKEREKAKAQKALDVAASLNLFIANDKDSTIDNVSYGLDVMANMLADCDTAFNSNGRYGIFMILRTMQEALKFANREGR